MAEPEIRLHRFKAIIAYDGTNYAGWQVQPDRITVQSEVERAIREVTGESPRVYCSGRTDTGVHAVGQVVHFELVSKLPARRLFLALNSKLPPDIRILRIVKTRPDFDARFSATGKEYRYFIFSGPQIPPHLRFYCAHVFRKLDIKRMKAAAALLEGTHDFAAFSANPGHEREGTVRTIYSLKVRRSSAGGILIVARGNGFLYKMVRSLAGFLIRVGTGEVAPEATVSILASKERTARVPTAAACGLFLWRVEYGHAKEASARTVD